MAHLTYNESRSVATKTIIILAVITIVEVLLALLGKGHLIEGVTFPTTIYGIIMVVLSLVKAYLIIYEFMHMKYEDNTMVRTVLFPTVLLIWAVIAFVWEGSYWQESRFKAYETQPSKVLDIDKEDLKQSIDKEEVKHIDKDHH